jgi:hypothetical protein
MRTSLPSFSTYGNYSSGNYGAHALRFTDDRGNQYWFSYQTLVAFESRMGRRIVRQNDWGPTTGKHLNAIDGGNKKARISGEAFERMFQAEFGEQVA